MIKKKNFLLSSDAEIFVNKHRPKKNACVRHVVTIFRMSFHFAHHRCWLGRWSFPSPFFTTHPLSFPPPPPPPFQRQIPAPICCECLGSEKSNQQDEPEPLISDPVCGKSVHPKCRVYSQELVAHFEVSLVCACLPACPTKTSLACVRFFFFFLVFVCVTGCTRSPCVFYHVFAMALGVDLLLLVPTLVG